MKIDYKQLNHADVIYDNLGIEISDISHQVYTIIIDFVLIWENMGHIKPLFWHIVPSLILKSEKKVINASSAKPI